MSNVSVGIDGHEHRRAGAPKDMGQRAGPTPQAGTFLEGCDPRTGERPYTKMGEGFQRCRRKRLIVQPRAWTRQHVTPRRTDGERGIDQAYTGIGLWEVPRWTRVSGTKNTQTRSDLVLCIVTVLGTHDAADCRIVQAHGAPDVGRTIAVVHVRTANGLVTSSPVGPETAREQLAQRRSGRKPLLLGNLFQWTLLPEPRRQTFGESLAPEEHLSWNLFPG